MAADTAIARDLQRISMSSTIQKIQDEIVSDFAIFDDWMDKYKYIIDLGRKLPEYPEEFKTDKYRIFGCQSMVWIHCQGNAQAIQLQATSDSAIVGGLIAILLKVFNNRSPQEILDSNVDFITKIGLSEHLSPYRANGLDAMIKQIWLYATALKGQSE